MTEADFWAALEADPTDWDCYAVSSDFLEEHDREPELVRALRWCWANQEGPIRGDDLAWPVRVTFRNPKLWELLKDDNTPLWDHANTASFAAAMRLRIVPTLNHHLSIGTPLHFRPEEVGV